MAFLREFDHLKIKLEDIKSATDNFGRNKLIGCGGFGQMYKGELLLPNGPKTVAFRRVDSKLGQGNLEFYKELMMLSKYKHENLVSLMYYCIEDDETILVYEYAPRGSLDRYLSDSNLTWSQRLKICVRVARAINFLHDPAKTHHIVLHRDIKSSNILLDDKWTPKVSDFGLSKVLSKVVPDNQADTYLITNAVGTAGYCDPLYMETGFLTKESDVYSFGVVLFEIMCGRLCFECQNGSLSQVLVNNWRKRYEEKRLDEIIFFDIKEQMQSGSLTTFSRIAYRCINLAREERPTMAEVVKELEIALEQQNYREFAHLKVRLEDILSATNSFDDENLIREDGFGKDYLGKMPRSGQLIHVCARRLKCKDGQGDIEFWTEISMLCTLKHRNIISLIGFCDEIDERVIVYEHAAHGSLDQHLSGTNLTWFQRLKICLGVAHGLSYIHYDVVHCDINSSKIFLDKDWEPKISGFELSTKYPQSWGRRLLSSHSFDNTNMTPKYDVYCFGVLLFEVLYAVKPTKTQRQGIINPKLREEMDRESLTLLTNIIDKCLIEQPVQRPTMDQVVKELEDTFEFQLKHQNLEHSTAADRYEGTSSGLRKLELSEIRRATNGFDEDHFIASGGFGIVYKGELDVSDIQNSSIEGERSNSKISVAIKCIRNRQDAASKQGFIREIELLTSCKHKNVISLIGSYMEADDIMLVYEYASKGSLSDYLRSTRKNINLTWGKRLEICLDIARGISYLHTSMEGKPRIIHRDIKSENILLDENLNAKIADFGLSRSHSTSQQPRSTVQTKHIVGTDFYVDPEYVTSAKYKKESDIYSFGVVLFEMLSGRLAYEQICTLENDKGLAPIARRRFNEETLKELIDPKMIDEDGEHIVTLNKGPNQESFEAFSRIAYQCLAETQAKRPAMEDVIKELENALNLQGETVVLSRFRLADILLATKNFSETCCIGSHEYGKVYKAELDDFVNKSLLAFKEKSDGEWPKTWPKACVNVAIKRISSSMDGKQRFFSEIERRTSCKHPNIVNVVGFCDEGDELILVYEHASNKSLDYYMKNVDYMDNLTWTQRLYICLGIARGLNHLHTKMDSKVKLIYGNITSANIVFGENLEPKIAYFGISEFYYEN